MLVSRRIILFDMCFCCIYFISTLIKSSQLEQSVLKEKDTYLQVEKKKMPED